MLHLIEAAVDRVEAVGDVRKEQWPFVPQQTEKGVGQHLVGAVADEDLLGGKTVEVGDRRPQAVGVGVGVEPQVSPVPSAIAFSTCGEGP